MLRRRRYRAALAALALVTVAVAVAALLGLGSEWLVAWVLIAAVGATGLVLLDRIDSLQQQVSDLSQQARRGPPEPRAGESQRTAATPKEMRRLNKEQSRRDRDLVANISAVITLHSLFTIDAPVPPPDKWAAMPDLQLYLVSQVLTTRPDLVVECGSGTSTMWLGHAARKVGGCRVVALEHEQRFADATRRLITAHGLDDVVDVRHAPLQTQPVDGESRPWYARSAWSDLTGIGMLLVDGPPAGVAKHARLPALPLLADALSTRATVILDDADRPAEREIIEAWSATRPGSSDTGWEVQRLEATRGAAVLVRRYSETPVMHASTGETTGES